MTIGADEQKASLPATYIVGARAGFFYCLSAGRYSSSLTASTLERVLQQISPYKEQSTCNDDSLCASTDGGDSDSRRKQRKKSRERKRQQNKDKRRDANGKAGGDGGTTAKQSTSGGAAAYLVTAHPSGADEARQQERYHWGRTRRGPHVGAIMQQST